MGCYPPVIKKKKVMTLIVRCDPFFFLYATDSNDQADGRVIIITIIIIGIISSVFSGRLLSASYWLFSL